MRLESTDIFCLQILGVAAIGMILDLCHLYPCPAVHFHSQFRASAVARCLLLGNFMASWSLANDPGVLCWFRFIFVKRCHLDTAACSMFFSTTARAGCIERFQGYFLKDMWYIVICSITINFGEICWAHLLNHGYAPHCIPMECLSCPLPFVIYSN